MDLKKLKGLLAENDYSKKRLAQELELSTVAIYKKLQGKIPFKLIEIENICKIFNVSINYFFE